MQIAVCDDNELHLLELKEQLSSLPMVENAFFFSDLSLFLFSIDGGDTYDAVLMDIYWGRDETGIDAAAALYNRSPETRIVYVTGYSDKFSQHIFLSKANLSGFITKPVDMEILKANLQKIADASPFTEQPALTVRQHGTIISIPFREIYFIESYKHTVTIYGAKEPVISYEKIGKIVESLPPGFYMCHKSYIVNMRQIKRFQYYEIVLKNGKVIPVSRSKYNETKEAYLSFMGKTF